MLMSVAIVVVVVVCVVVCHKRWRRPRRWRRGRMATSSVIMRQGQDSDQVCLITNEEPVARVKPASNCPTDSVGGRMAVGPSPSEKEEVDVSFQFSGGLLFEPAVAQSLQSSTVQPPESSGDDQQLQPVTASRDDLA